MKRLSVLFAALLFAAVTAVPAMAGPSRALIQEMGAVTGKDEVNIDLDWVPQSLNVASKSDTTVGNGNATTGGIVLSSVNIGLTEKLELRIGRMPGLRSYLTLPHNAIGGSPNNYGLTIKGAIPGVSGLAAWLGYGSTSLKDINSGNTAGDVESSSFRAGAAYTWAGPVILNGSLDYAVDASKSAGVSAKDTKTTEVAVAALYPLRSTLLVGAELHYATIDMDTVKIDSLIVPALGARAIAGNWTIDAIVALAGASVKTNVSGADTATATVIGVPTLRVNYKF